MDSLQSFYAANAFFAWLGTVFLVLVLLLWVLTLQGRLSRTVRHYRLLTQGVEGNNLQEILDKQVSRSYETSMRVEELGKYSRELDQTLQRAIQRVGLVRFNPFNDTGGDQSFVIALLDAAGDGIVISSIFSRKDSRIYAKAVHHGDSRYPLSEEEREAIQQAIQNSAPARRS